MRRKNREARRTRSLAEGGLVLVALLAGHARAQDEIADLWNDPTFKKQFVASYGINSEIEPRVTPEEVALLEKIRPLMAADPMLRAPSPEIVSESTLTEGCWAIRSSRSAFMGVSPPPPVA